MKRRQFSLGVASAVGTGGVLSSLWSGTASAQAALFKAGTDYMQLDKPAPVEAPAGKIEVVEFFWYSCPHCNAFEPTLAQWIPKLPKEVAFRRVPVAFRDDFNPQQRLFYTLEAMGLVEKLHAKVFAAIHAEKQNLAKSEAILDWVGKQGVDVAKFKGIFESFAIATKASKAAQLQNAYGVEGVPSMGVAGRFYTDATLAQSMERVLQVVGSLIATVRGGK